MRTFCVTAQGGSLFPPVPDSRDLHERELSGNVCIIGPPVRAVKKFFAQFAQALS